jgi:hypothetical protein
LLLPPVVVVGLPPLPLGVAEPPVLQAEASRSAMPKLKIESLVMTKTSTIRGRK